MPVDSPPAPPLAPRAAGDDEKIAERRLKAITMRRAGASYRAIGRQLGVDVRTAWEDVQAEMQSLADLTKDEAQYARDLEVARIDDLLLALSPLIKPSMGKKPDAYAVDVARKLSESRRKLLGLDAPTKVAPTKPDGTELPGVSDRLARFLAGLEAARDSEAADRDA